MQLNNLNKPAIALTACLIGVVAISCGSILVRFSTQELSPYATAFYRLLLAVVVFGAWNGYQAISQRCTEAVPVVKQSTTKTLLLLLSAGLLWAATLASMFWALTRTSIAITTTLHNLAPIFTSLGAWFLFGQKFERQFMVGVVVAIAGVGLIEAEEMRIAFSRVQGDLIAILSAVFLAAYLLIVEKLRTQMTVSTIQMWVCGIGASVSLPLLLLTHNYNFPQSINGWLVVIALTLVCQVFGHGLLTFSLAKLSSVTISLVHLLEPVFSSIFAWAIFWEQLNLWSWLGFAIVLIGLYLTISSHTTLELSQDTVL